MSNADWNWLVQFIDAIQEEPDLFLLVGHMPVSLNEPRTIFKLLTPSPSPDFLHTHLHLRLRPYQGSPSTTPSELSTPRRP
jgi:hypothetical protein